MENKAKPRICEVLGVEVGERFQADTPNMFYKNLEIGHDGVVYMLGKSQKSKEGSVNLCYMINHPECIQIIRRWTPEEVELAKAIKVVWPEAYSIMRGTNSSSITIFSPKTVPSGVISSSRFPSLNPGEKVLLSNIIGDDENE